MSKAVIKAKSGGYFTTFIEVEAENTIQDSVFINWEFPKGWKNLITKNPTNYKGETTLKYLFSIGIGGNVNAGSYKIPLKLYSITNNLLDSDSLNISIEKERRVNITTYNLIQSAKENDTLTFKYVIENLGNAIEKIKIKPENISFSNPIDSTLEIGVKESKEIMFQTIVPVKQLNYWILSPKVQVLSADSSKNLAYSSSSIEIFSSKLKKQDRYLRFPIEAGAWYNTYIVGSKVISGIQFDVRGKGFLDKNAKHSLDFTLHGPNQFNIPMVGSVDIYHLLYSYNNKSNIELGDFVLRFDNLLQFGRFGRGGQYEQIVGKNKFRIFYIEPRFVLNQKRETGAGYEHTFNEKFRLGINYMYKEGRVKSDNYSTNLLNLTSNFKYKNIELSTEAAGSVLNEKLDFGLFNQFIIYSKKITFNSLFNYSGQNFQGFLNNSLVVSNSISFQFNKKFGISFSNNLSRINPRLDLLALNTSPFNNSFFVYFNITPNRKNTISIGYNYIKREDRFEPKRFDYKDDIANLNYSYKGRVTTINYFGRYGKSLNLLIAADEGNRNDYISNALQTNHQVLKWLSFGALFDQQRTSRFSRVNQLQDFYYYGGQISIHLKDRLSFNANYRNGFSPDELTQTTNIFGASIAWDSKFHHLSINGGKTFIPQIPGLTLQNSDLTFFNVKCLFKINAPISKLKNFSSIKGKVDGLGSLINKKGLIIELGNRRYMTDSMGNFVFDRLVADTYTINISRESMQTGVVSSLKLPIIVKLSADSVSNINIPLIKTGGIEGEINLVKSNSIVGQNDENKLPKLVIKLANEKETFGTEVDNKNKFSFKEMKPGNWKMTAILITDTDKFMILNAEQSITISIDTIKKVEFTVKPIERKIYFSSNNFNLVTKNEEKAKKEEPKKETKIQPISKSKTDSLTSDIKKIKQEETKRPIKTVQNNFPKKTFDKVSVRPLRRKTRVVIQAPKRNVWKGFDGRIVWNSPNQSSEQNTFSPNTSSNDNTATDTSELTDTEPNRNLKNKERQRR